MQCVPAKAVLIAMAILTAGTITACTPAWRVPSVPEVFIAQPLDHYYHQAVVGIVAVGNRNHSWRLGLDAARMLKAALVREDVFRQLVLLEEARWPVYQVREDAFIEQALFEAQKAGADLVVMGTLDEYQTAHLSDSRVTFSCRVIEVSSGQTKWWGLVREHGKPGKTFLLMNHLPGADAPSGEQLLQAAAGKIALAIKKNTVGIRNLLPFGGV